MTRASIRRRPAPAIALASLVLSVLLAACAAGPDYVRPEVESPVSWSDTTATKDSSIANVAWWEVFQDSVLQELVDTALVNNKDLKIATERILEAGASFGYTKADFWPHLDIDLGAGGRRLGGVDGTDQAEGVFRAGGTLSWEIDLFGRIRRAAEAEEALLFATEEARRGVIVALVAEVGRAYMDLRDADQRAEIARRTLASRKEYVEYSKTRFEGGVTSETDWRQAEAEYYRTASFLSEFERRVKVSESELSVLLGRNPGPILRGRSLDQQAVLPEVPAGIPSSLLERRPDVRAAEQELIASNARIGEAKALLYPQLSLTGVGGVTSSTLETLFNGPAVAWSLMSGLVQPLFNAGKNTARVELNESRMRQTLYFYESTVQQAFREVEDGLITYQKTGEQRSSQNSRVVAQRQVLNLAELRYRGGTANYLEVLDAQRSLFEAEIDEVQATSNQLKSMIQLYKALGGGWMPEPEAGQDSAE
jgi:multidrug efflux system outer membrane protein